MKKENPVNSSENKTAFPAIIKLSFAPLFKSLRKMALDEDKATAIYAVSILEEMKSYPLLEEGFSDLSLLKEYQKPISKLLRLLFPDVLSTNEIKAVTAPFDFTPIFLSTRFKNILNAAGGDFKISVMDISDDEMYIFGCSVILAQHYHYSVDLSTPFRLPIPDPANNIERIYRVAFNADMISVEPTDKAPHITLEDYAILIDRFTDIELWKEKFPPGSYIVSGISIINLMDVTVDQSIAGITTNLLSKSDLTPDQVSGHIKNIFRNPDLQAGFINYENDTFCFTPNQGNNYGILLNKHDQSSCNKALCTESYAQVIENRQPLVITDTERYYSAFKSELAETLIRQGVGSYMLIPLIYENEMVGFLELASKKKHELSQASLRKLTDVIPVLSMAISHYKTEAINEREAIIQREFTQIHPSVKWRFEEEAAKYLNEKQSNKKAVLQDLDFPNVYPLYGQLDIKGSSMIRNEVIQKDFTSQLTAVKNIVLKAFNKKPLPLYEELNFRIGNFISELKKSLQAGSEHDILHFLKKDVYPVFEHLKKTDKAASLLIKNYEQLLDPHLNMIYEERKNFDETIALINNTLTNHLDKRQEEAQDMFPHYFERYKTDGVEYNLYIGDSIARGVVFDKIFVQNLRLWQLIVMCELENEFNYIKNSLPHPLEIASLIMVHSDPLAIHFRLDEKRFDVKGAYNARYEIIKKRVDKAYIKNTRERITVPGKIVIVYSNDQDAAEYIKYLNFLIAKGYFKKGSLEKLLLDDMQGITGLQALRVSVNYTEKIKENDKLTISQLMEAMEKN